MTGTLVNIGTIVAGTTIGLLLKHRLPRRRLKLGINILELKKIRTGNMLPALLFAVLFTWLNTVLKPGL